MLLVQSKISPSEFMSNYSLFINGVYRRVLDDIRKAHESEPDLILYLQPYSGQLIVRLAKDPPTQAHPVTLFLSTTTEVAKVSYTCEIVGWCDKTKLGERELAAFSEVIQKYQPTERGGIYMRGHESGPEAKNLLHVMHMRRLSLPFSVEHLVKQSDHSRYSPNRTTAGGWSYVENPDPDFLYERVNGFRRTK